MKIENMKSNKGNNVANQFLIRGEKETTFQSYNKTIARTYYSEMLDTTMLELNGDWWDYTNTTRKYFKQFINEETPYTYENKAQWLKEIETNPNIEVL